MKRIEGFFLNRKVLIVGIVIAVLFALLVTIGFPVLLFQNWHLIGEYLIRSGCVLVLLAGVIVLVSLRCKSSSAGYSDYTNY